MFTGVQFCCFNQKLTWLVSKYFAKNRKITFVRIPLKYIFNELNWNFFVYDIFVIDNIFYLDKKKILGLGLKKIFFGGVYLY